ncbi:hypothetical protein LCGC14_1348170 [marine sediment metagenome]|uniref:Uncharacterized protein n=1 Tax=marine sediment metagenome TaxID=412755 RepID=A0A0F9KBQ8_9ZZZZ
MTTITLECFDCGTDLVLEHNEQAGIIRVHYCQSCHQTYEKPIVTVNGSTITITDKEEYYA